MLNGVVILIELIINIAYFTDITNTKSNTFKYIQLIFWNFKTLKGKLCEQA